MAGGSLTMLADTALKGTVLLLGAWLLVLALRHASAATRHLVWLCALVGAALLPLVAVVAPRWQIAVLPPLAVTSGSPSSSTKAAGVGTAPLASADLAPRTRSVASRAAADAPRSFPSSSAHVAGPRSNDAAPPGFRSSSGTMTTRRSLDAGRSVLLVWLVGAAALLVRLLAGLVATWRMGCVRRTAGDPAWAGEARRIASVLGIRSPLRVIEADAAAMPMVCGIRQPLLVMPRTARTWSADRLSAVLLHELAHVKRHDCLTQAIAHVACALHWFNPLVWLGARRLRVERERACDDLVLRAGLKGTDYASHLLELARTLRTQHPTLAAAASVAMARRSQLEGRVVAVLDPSVRREPPAWGARLGLLALFVAIVVPLGAVQPVPRPGRSVGATGKDVSPLRTSRSLEPASDGQTAVVDAGEARAAIPRASAEEATIALGESIPTGPSTSAASSVDVASAAPRGSARPSDELLRSLREGLGEAVRGAVRDVMQTDRSGAGSVPVDAATVEALLAALTDRDPNVRRAIVYTLARVNDPRALAAVTALLQDEVPGVRQQAVYALGQAGSAEAVPALVAAAADPDAGVRQQAVYALGRIGDVRAFDPLVQALEDLDADVRQAAVYALTQIDDPRALPAILPLAQDAAADVREQAIHAVGEMGDTGHVDMVIAALRDEDEDVRQQAAHALGELRDARAVEPLVAATKDVDPDVREQVSYALGEIRDTRAGESLAALLRDEDAGVRERAAHALGELRDRRAVPALVEALRDEQAGIRQQAARALGELRDPGALAALTSALKDENANVREAVARAIAELVDR